MKSKILMLISLCLLTIGSALGQTITVKGIVTDERGDGVIGATVRLKSDATVGTMTGMDGDFTLKAKQGEIIIVSYVGYKTQEVAAAPTLNIKLVPDTELLDDVIVVAYGTAKKESFTGSAAVVDSKSLSKVQAPDAVRALQGKVPGLQLSNVTGAPGSETTIRLRGVGSINASSAPLVILNGAPYDGNINSINTRDIENISVLKDAASAALYGARGANGVIIITTKNGRKGITNVEFEARLGVNQRGVPEYDRITDPGTYYETYWDAIRNNYMYREADEESGIKPLPMEEANKLASKELVNDYLGYNVYNVPNDQLVINGKLNPAAAIKYEDAGNFNDWAGLLMSPKMRQEYNLSLTRGSEKSTTLFSVGYLDDKGYAVNTGFERISSRLSFTSQLFDWLRLQSSSQLALTSGNFGAGEDSSGTFSNIFFFTRSMPPIYPVYQHDADGKIMHDAKGNAIYDTGAERRGINGTRLFSANKNIVGENELNQDQYKRVYLVQNARADIDLTHGFKFNTTFTYGFTNNRTSYFINPRMGDGVAYGGILDKWDYQTTSVNWNQILTYDTKVGDFTLQGMLGHESYSRENKNLGGEKRATLDPYSLEFNTYAQITDLNSGGASYAVEGYFAQFTGDYQDKYYLSASLRRDATSVFAPDTRWGTFWSLGASWRLTQEDFMQNVTWLNNLKLRTSIGQQGNDTLYDPDGYRMYTPYQNLYSVGSDGSHSSLSSKYMGNPDITWEKNLNLSVGLEASMFDSRLTAELDFFMRHTTDMLFNEPVSKTTGFTFQPKNIGSMRNTGFEFNIGANVVRTEDVNLTIGVNGMTYKNKILTLPERFKEKGLSSGVRILKEGGGIYDIYQVKYAGVDPENGNSLYYKYNDEKKNETDDDFIVVGSEGYRSEIRDRQFIGSAIPKLEGGFYTNLMAYGFDFGMQFTYRWGGKIYDRGYSNLMHSGGSKESAQAWHKDILNRWTPDNRNTNVPRLQINNQKLISGSDMFIVDASYLSLSNITLGYTLPKKWIETIGLQNARVYCVADNVFVLSARKGLDPRTSLSGASADNRTSAIRTISGGVSITF